MNTARDPGGHLERLEVDGLDDCDIIVRRDPACRPAPGLVAYALRRAQVELDRIGLELVVRPKRHGPPAGGSRSSAPVPDAVDQVDAERREVVASRSFSEDDGAMSDATVAPVEPAMSIAAVTEALRLRLIKPDDVPRFLGGRSLEEAIAHSQAARADELLDADGNYDPPPPAFIRPRRNEENPS